MDFDVFISYPHQDKTVADAACAKLEANGIRCWIAPRDVPPGTEWAGAIVDAIDNCRAMVLIFSSSTNGSRQIRREVQQAFDGEKPVVPFRIEDVTPEKSLRYYMGSVHWLDALTPPLEQHLEKLAISVRTFVNASSANDTTQKERLLRDAETRQRTEESHRRPEEQRRDDVVAEAERQRDRHEVAAKCEVENPGQDGSPHESRVRELEQPKDAQEKAIHTEHAVSFSRAEGLIQINASIIHGTSNGLFRPGAGKIEWFKDLEAASEMVVVPAGSFVMGSPDTEKGRNKHEGPQHKVTFRNPFAVGRFAVTFDEWDACAAEGGCDGYRPKDKGWGRGRRPVIEVSWHQAKAYAAWLSEKTGKPYRLLSEAEWEYVARAGTSAPYWWGQTVTPNQANYPQRLWQILSRKGTVPVDAYEPNPWGLYQVLGNVWEWTEDSAYLSYQGAPIDGSAWRSPPNNDIPLRCVRGGSWETGPDYVRAARRSWYTPDDRFMFVGFRVARTLESQRSQTSVCYALCN